MTDLMWYDGTTDTEIDNLIWYDGTNDFLFGESLSGKQRIPRDYAISGSRRSGGYYVLVPLLASRIQGSLFRACTGYLMRVPVPTGSRLQSGTSSTLRSTIPADTSTITDITWTPNRLYTTASLGSGSRVVTLYFRV